MQTGAQQKGQGTCKLSVVEEDRLHSPEKQSAAQQLQMRATGPLELPWVLITLCCHLWLSSHTPRGGSEAFTSK